MPCVTAPEKARLSASTEPILRTYICGTMHCSDPTRIWLPLHLELDTVSIRRYEIVASSVSGRHNQYGHSFLQYLLRFSHFSA